MKLFLKILFFIFTMILITVGEAKSSTVVAILQEEASYSFFQKSQHDVVIFENHNANFWTKERNAVTYCERVISIGRSVAKGGAKTLYSVDKFFQARDEVPLRRVKSMAQGLKIEKNKSKTPVLQTT